MKFKILFFLLFVGLGLNAQEYWDREDFEIGNRGIENSWKEIGFTWQTESKFSLPDGSFLHLKDYNPGQQIDMVAIIDQTNRSKIQRKVELGSPLPYAKKDKKFMEVSLEPRLRDQNDILTNPYYANPFLNNYNYRGFGMQQRYYTRFDY
ncbi:hypothetical protein MKO06_08020 [Gramella sp. GC03-9]|uniref:Uncharacterized protein n=1 Tax=Christiangramia oceanisediminis TaxID=2920386 RepID=A0A9X2I5M5_9FLAO|nr:hypothetical protein [Gramella oceanisediminis]MCP9199847.1 hypothetical protein [Gramella oceanisediminis]